MFIVFIGACSYGFVGTVVKLAYAEGFTTQELVGAQTFFAAIILWILAMLFSKRRPSRKEAMQLLGAGTCIGTTSLCYYSSLQYLDASIAIVMLFQFTWIGILLEAIIQRKRPLRSEWIAIGILAVGTVMAAGMTHGGFELNPLGVTWGLLSAVSFAFVFIVSGRVAPAVSSWNRAALLVTGGLTFIFLVSPPMFLINGSLQQGLWMWAGANAFSSTVIPIGLFSLGVPHIGPASATILGAAELPSSVFVSWVLLRESISSTRWWGVLVILIGIAYPELSRSGFFTRMTRRKSLRDS